MNDDRRKQLSKANIMLADARMIMEQVRDGEQEAFDNLPESLQQGKKGTAMEEAISTLEDAISGIEDAERSCDDASV